MVAWGVPSRARSLLVALVLAACSPPANGGETEAATTAVMSTTSTSGDASSTDAPTTSAAASSTTGDTTGEPGNLLLSDRFLDIAHRGGGAVRPEETLPAFENALAVGADVLEFDVHRTADGVLVAMHDDTVDRTTDGVGAIADMTFDALRMLDAGYQFTADGGQTYPYRGMGVVVPTVDEILGAFPGAYFCIEIKGTQPEIPGELLAAIAAHEATERVVLASFSTESIAAVRAMAPGVFTSLSLDEMVEFLDRVDDPSYVPPGLFVQPPWAAASQENVDRAHALGMKIHPWTVNDAAAMKSLIARGVDGIMTDDPELLAGLAPP